MRLPNRNLCFGTNGKSGDCEVYVQSGVIVTRVDCNEYYWLHQRFKRLTFARLLQARMRSDTLVVQDDAELHQQ